MYFSGQGKLKIAALIAGVPQAFRWVGNVPDFAPKFDTTKKEHKESYTGQRLLDKTLTTENKSSFSASLEDWSKENLALAVRGAVQESDTDPVVDEVAPSGLVAGSIWALKGQKVTALTVEDSTGSPLTLVLDTDYTLDADYGTIVILDPTGFVQPFKASYTPGAVDIVPFFTEGITEVALRFEGVNTADGNKKVLVELYKVALDPTKELGLITDDYGKFTLEGNCLIDPERPEDALFGQFGRMVYID